MNALERSDSIIKDILVNHLPRVKEGLEQGYVDENQILVIYDHAPDPSNEQIQGSFMAI